MLAKGTVTLNLSAGYDEEGITAKPFEIAASAAWRCCTTKRRAWAISLILARKRSPFHAKAGPPDRPATDRRSRQSAASVGAAARARLERDHSWDTRLKRLLSPVELARPISIGPCS